MEYVRQYVEAIWANWVSRMSGIAGLVLIVIALVFSLTERGQTRYWIAAAVICYIIASFSAWRTERLKTAVASRSFISTTPGELVGVFNGRTEVQGNELAKVYHGKWIKVDGEIGEVSVHPNKSVWGFDATFVMVNFPTATTAPFHTVFMRFSKESKGQLSVLRKGESIKVQGKIGEVTRFNVWLNDCELLLIDQGNDVLDRPQLASDASGHRGSASE